MKKKVFLAFLLCFLQIFCAVAPSANYVYADSNTVVIKHEGNTIDEMTICKDEKKVVTAHYIGSSDVSYQWQLLAPVVNKETTWVNIYDKKSKDCEISYALLKNLLDESGSTYIRCKAVFGDYEYVSNPVSITVSSKMSNSGSETEELKMKLQKDGYAEKATIVPPSEKSEPVELVEDTAVDAIENKEGSEEASTEEVAIDTEGSQVEEEEEGDTAVFRSIDVKMVKEAGNDSVSTIESEEGVPFVEKEYVSVTIKYLDSGSLSNGVESSIYSPYIATLEKGSSFEQDVISPTFLGFAPFYDKNGDGSISEDASVISLNYDSVDNNIEIKVYYKPAKVPFAVRYFFQNLSDDLYTEDVSRYHTDTAETGSIVSDEYLIEKAGDTTGYEMLYHYPESVAANGSTVFECYYDRNYYLVSFDLNGGYGVEPLYARYGSPYIVNNPIRHGYVFKGWDLLDENGNGDGVADEVYSKIPSKNLKYRALWSTTETSYTVVYWYENANDDGYSVAGTKEVSGVLSNTVVTSNQHQNDNFTGKDSKHFTYNGNKNERCVIEGDGSSVLNVYFKRNTYTITFKATGVCQLEGHTHTKDCGELDCSIPVHEKHSEECLTCKITPHTHSSECCSLVEHDHTAVCYISSTSRCRLSHTGASTSAGTTYTHDTGVTCVRYNSRWYNYTEGVINSTYCKSHIHGGNDCQCDIEVHVHGDSCYGDSLHTHGDLCYNYVCGKIEHTHSTACNNKSSSNIIKVVTRKWNADLGDIFPVVDLNGKVYNSGERWKPSDSTYYSQVLVYISVMPDDDFVLTLNEASYDTFRMHYNLEALPGESGTSYNGRVYNEGFVVSANYNYITEAEDFFNIKGFSKVSSNPSFSGGQIDINGGGDVNFYYSRNKYNLSFYNYNGVVDGKGGSVLYESSLEDYYFKPDYPDTLEENAYDFAGWYTTEGCYEGSEFDFSTGKMPSDNLVLYAKWVPLVHKVNFFSSYDDMLLYEEQVKEGSEITVTPYTTYSSVQHGTVVGSVGTPDAYVDGNLNLVFSGWFYIVDGEKKAFSPLDMPINRDINVFADWGSNQPQPYRLEYVLQGTDTKLADDTTGFAYGGSTRTFIAKVGNPYNQLYKEYNEGYFPTVASHSITMKYEEDIDNLKHNVYSFEYVKATDIEYTVRYINKETNAVMDEKKMTTNNGVVTERFVAYENMVPDAFYKRLFLSVEYDEKLDKWVGTADNVINFYYTPNKTSAFYAVHFMMEKVGATEEEKKNFAIDGSGGYEESGTHVEGVGDVNSNITITPQNFSGFKLVEDSSKSVVNGVETQAPYKDGKYSIKVTTDGTELYIFYAREKYDYKVNYYLYNTSTPVDEVNFPSETGSEIYGAEVEKKAKNIPGYTCVSDTVQSIPIRDKVEQNVINFYYSPTQYVAEYIPVTEEGGWLSSTIEVCTGNKVFEGSEPKANPHYEFKGWYMDEECTVSAEEYGTIDKETGKFIPDKSKLSDTERNIFYAKFDCKTTDLTITRSNSEDDTQVYVYDIIDIETDNVITVSIVGNGSVTVHDLLQGVYRVEQKNDWSWRYADSSQEIVLDDSQENVSFNGNVVNKYWLNGNSSLIKNIRGLN